jgi:hypothetical protein
MSAESHAERSRDRDVAASEPAPVFAVSVMA